MRTQGTQHKHTQIHMNTHKATWKEHLGRRHRAYEVTNIEESLILGGGLQRFWHTWSAENKWRSGKNWDPKRRSQMVLSGNSEVFAPDVEERHAHILGEEELRNELVKSTESRSFHHQLQLRNPGVIPETLLPNRLSRWF